MLESLQYYNFKMGSHHASPEISNTPESNGAHFEHFRMSGNLTPELNKYAIKHRWYQCSLCVC